MRLALRPKLVAVANGHRQARGKTGAVLLEVVLALVLFVAAASILTGGMTSSLDALDRLRLNTHAADMAATVLSELQMGLKSFELGGPQPFEPPVDGWTWELVEDSMETESEDPGPFTKVEVIIRHDDPPLVYRLTQVLQLDEGMSGSGRGNSEDEMPGMDSF